MLSRRCRIMVGAMVDLMLPGFSSASMQDRREWVAALCSDLGETWSFEAKPELDAVVAHHAPTDLDFVVVPGGRYVMGLRSSDWSALGSHLELTQQRREWLTRSTQNLLPPHEIEVRPFLAARHLLSPDHVENLSEGRFEGRFCHALGREDARELARSLGFRLLSEAEWEWLARDGGKESFTLGAAERLDEIRGDSTKLTSRFGVFDLFECQWMEDDYHASYADAPTDSTPWYGGDPVGVARGGSMPEYVDGPEQVPGLLAAMRSNGTVRTARVRLALPLP